MESTPGSGSEGKIFLNTEEVRSSSLLEPTIPPQTNESTSSQSDDGSASANGHTLGASGPPATFEEAWVHFRDIALKSDSGETLALRNSLEKILRLSFFTGAIAFQSIQRQYVLSGNLRSSEALMLELATFLKDLERRPA